MGADESFRLVLKLQTFPAQSRAAPQLNTETVSAAGGNGELQEPQGHAQPTARF